MSMSVIIVVKTVLVVICGENRGNNSGSVSVNECDNSCKTVLVVICGENRGNNSGSVSVNECDNSSKNSVSGDMWRK